MDKKQVELKFIFLTLFLTCVLALPIVSSVKLSPHLDVPVATNRGPASLGPAAALALPTSAIAKEGGSITLDLNCQNSRKHNQIQYEKKDIASSRIRFRNKDCFHEKLKKVVLKNKSNGYTAEVFFMNESYFTTDFIDLKNGENQFELSGVDQKGRRVVRSFVLDRKAPDKLSD